MGLNFDSFFDYFLIYKMDIILLGFLIWLKVKKNSNSLE